MVATNDKFPISKLNHTQKIVDAITISKKWQKLQKYKLVCLQKCFGAIWRQNQNASAIYNRAITVYHLNFMHELTVPVINISQMWVRIISCFLLCFDVCIPPRKLLALDKF